MSDPIVALCMLAIFLFIILLGFPVAFTLMAMGIGFGYYAYFDARPHVARLQPGGRGRVPISGLRSQLWVEGLFNNRIFDLFVNQTYSVMANDVLTAVPLFLFMGYIVERANIVDRLFSDPEHRRAPRARLDGGGRADHLRAVRHRHRHRRRGRDADGPAGLSGDAQGALRHQPRRRASSAPAARWAS